MTSIGHASCKVVHNSNSTLDNLNNKRKSTSHSLEWMYKWKDSKQNKCHTSDALQSNTFLMTRYNTRIVHVTIYNNYNWYNMKDNITHIFVLSTKETRERSWRLPKSWTTCNKIDGHTRCINLYKWGCQLDEVNCVGYCSYMKAIQNQ